MATNAGQLWKVDSLGGHLGNPILSKQMRMAASPRYKFRQFVKLKEALGKHNNDTVFFNKYSKVDTSASTSGLSETDTMPEGKFEVDRGTITVTEYGNSIPYTGKLQALSEFDVDNPILNVLKDDMGDTIDRLAAKKGFLELSNILTYCISASGTTAGTFETGVRPSDAQIGPMTTYHVKEIVDKMKKNNVPPYDDNGNYMCIASVNALRSIKDDSDWEAAAKYGDPERLFSGEVGRYYGCRFVEENNVLRNNCGSNGDRGELVFFGEDAVTEAVAVPEEIRAKIPADYGRSKGLAWYAILGYEPTWKESDPDAHSRIIFVTDSSG